MDANQLRDQVRQIANEPAEQADNHFAVFLSGKGTDFEEFIHMLPHIQLTLLDLFEDCIEDMKEHERQLEDQYREWQEEENAKEQPMDLC